MRLTDLVLQPWAMEQEAFREIVAIYDRHLKGEKIDLDGLKARGVELAGATQGYSVRDGVALLPIDGVLSRKMNMLGAISGGTSYQTLQRDLRAALKDERAHSIVLLVDSPGGNTMGLQELAADIYAARAEKPIVTLTDSLMASAAYWLGSAAHEAYISSDMTQVGSIGVIAVHRDVSKMNEKMGVAVTEIVAGKYKNLGTPNAPLSDEAADEIKAMVSKLYSHFVDAVAKHRGVDAEAVVNKMADGRIFLGRDAVNVGLVDGVATLDELIADLNAGKKPVKRRTYMAGVGERVGLRDDLEHQLDAAAPALLPEHAGEVHVARNARGVVHEQRVPAAIGARELEQELAERRPVPVVGRLDGVGELSRYRQALRCGELDERATLRVDRHFVPILARAQEECTGCVFQHVG